MTPSSGHPAIGALVEELLRCTSFEQAARALLRAAVSVAEGTLAASAFAKSGRIIRGVLHWRPADGYRGLVVLEPAARPPSPSGTPPAQLSSTTAWHWVERTGLAASIDVQVGRIELGAGRDPERLRPSRGTEPGFHGAETRNGLLARDVTHLHVLPLRGPAHVVDGMLSLEAECRPAIGAPFVWPACHEQLQLLADVATPHLTSLPRAEAEPPQGDPLLPVVGASMAPLIALLGTFAEQEESLLITGPTGAGKSRLARWCHERSPRRTGPFELLDLCAVPEELQMAELFGWKKGAFTGATRDKAGYVARAEGGTVFLDEVDSLSLRAQAGLLHLLEDGTYRVLGDDGGEVRSNVRFIVGTNASLQDAVRERRFREDLYYRINVLPVRLPPLRERPDEIAPWARYMASRRHAASGAEGVASIARDAESLLTSHSWPGNLRQLDNAVRRAYAIASMANAARRPPFVIEAEHFRRALANEEPSGAGSLVAALMAAATAFVGEAERRGAAGMDLDWADAFKGFVVGVASERCGGDHDQAFRLLGKEKLVKARNHHKVLKREIERMESLCRALGEQATRFAGLAGGLAQDDGNPQDSDR